MLSLYLDPTSSPHRALHMAVDLLRLEHKYQEVDTAWTGPVLAEGGLAISEPLAALTYMASQHRPGQLYPMCAKVRSQVDQRLYFYLGTLHPRMEDCLLPVGSAHAAALQEEKVAALKEALLWANQMVANGYVCGSTMTIADLVFLATFATLEACNVVPLEIEREMGLETELEEGLEQEGGIVQDLEDTLDLNLDEDRKQSHSSCSGTLEKCTSSCLSTMEKTDLTHEMMSIEMYRNHEEDLELSRREQMQEYEEQQETKKERRDQLGSRRRQEEQVHLRGGTVSHLIKAFAALHQPLVSCSAEV